MRLGRHMREMWGHKMGLTIAVVIALVVAGRVFGVSLFPPGLDRGSGDSGRAVTHVLVDTPQSTLDDLRQGTYDIEGLTNRALLVSNAMASVDVRERIAKLAGVPVNAIRTSTPLNAEYPQGVAESSGPSSADGLSPSSVYRLEIESNPTVPLIDINTQAPTQSGATKLANAAAESLDSYLGAIASRGDTPDTARVNLVQLGQAQVVPTAHGAGIVFTALVFALVLAAASATVLFVTRVRAGWRATEEPLGPAPGGVA